MQELIIQDSLLRDASLSDELCHSNQSMLTQLKALKIYQCRADSVSWARILEENGTLESLVVENTQGLGAMSQNNQCANFASMILSNERSQLKSFDFACYYNPSRNNSILDVPFQMWFDLVTLQNQGRIEHYHLHNISRQSGNEVKNAPNAEIQHLKPFMHVQRS